MSAKIKSLLENNAIFFFIEIISIIVIITTGIIYGFGENEINWIFITCILFLVEVIFEMLRKKSKKQQKETNDNRVLLLIPGKHY